jgi:hypothetical protein
MTREQNVPFVLDDRCKELVAYVERKGPANTRRFVDDGRFNYPTYKPHLDHLVGLGIFKVDARSWFRLTPAAGPFLFDEWEQMNLGDKWESTLQDNRADLGLFEEVSRTLHELYPRTSQLTEHLPPLPSASRERRGAAEVMGKLDVNNPRDRAAGVTLLGMMTATQPPEVLRRELVSFQSRLNEIERKQSWDGRSLWDRISDWFWDSLPV